jgi:hypothetical protein
LIFRTFHEPAVGAKVKLGAEQRRNLSNLWHVFETRVLCSFWGAWACVAMNRVASEIQLRIVGGPHSKFPDSCLSASAWEGQEVLAEHPCRRSASVHLFARPAATLQLLHRGPDPTPDRRTGAVPLLEEPTRPGGGVERSLTAVLVDQELGGAVDVEIGGDRDLT